jgi:hypothetical protein
MAWTCSRFVFALAFVGLAACQSVAGIEDRHYEAPVTGSPECENYCDLVMKGCTGTFAAYPSRAVCVRTCDSFPHGEVDTNSIECRTAQAQLAVNGGEKDSLCKAAGPFGAGVCGTECDALCSILGKRCPSQLSGVQDCVAACSGIRSDGGYQLSNLTSGDTVQCRVAYASRAALDSKLCSSAALSSASAGSQCLDPADGIPSCDVMCKLAMAECTGTNQAYNSESDCKALCGFMTLGSNGNTSQDTVGCRKYHAYNAIAGPDTHCPHAGPTGGGHCGEQGNCSVFCPLMAKVCPGNFSDETSCENECNGLPDSDGGAYLGGDATGPSLHCRVINLQRAAANQNDPTFCAAAAGGGECAAGDGGA